LRDEVENEVLNSKYSFEFAMIKRKKIAFSFPQEVVNSPRCAGNI
jgi:hypothetical protein